MSITVSVLIRAYNAGLTLEEAVASIYNQSFKDTIELVICYDKGSSDNTYNIIKKIISKYKSSYVNIKVVEHEHVTPFRALLLCIKKANGKIITILDHDNIYPSTYIETILKYVKESYGNFLYTNTLIFSKENNRITILGTIFPGKLRKTNLFFINYIDASSIVLTRDCADTLLKFLEKISNNRFFEYVFEDYLIVLLAFSICKPVYVPSAFVLYRVHGANLTGFGHVDLYKLLLSAERSIKTYLAFNYIYSKNLSFFEKFLLYMSVLLRLFRYAYLAYKIIFLTRP
jgi:glycosyltransferase involved in cell wall biosynthesis